MEVKKISGAIKKPTHGPVIDIEFLEKGRQEIYTNKIRGKLFEIHKNFQPKD